jgi:hypothetical protein
MSKISGKDLIKLGFKVAVERSGNEHYHYYTYEINKHCMLISSSNDEKNLKGGYDVEFYEMSDIRFTELKDVKKLLKLLTKGRK